MAVSLALILSLAVLHHSACCVGAGRIDKATWNQKKTWHEVNMRILQTGAVLEAEAHTIQPAKQSAKQSKASDEPKVSLVQSSRAAKMISKHSEKHLILDVLVVLIGFGLLAVSISVFRRRQELKSKATDMVYEWDQTPSMMNVYVKLPTKDLQEGISHDVDVKLGQNHFAIVWKGNPPWMNEEFYAEIDAEASTWKVGPSGELKICLKKVQETQWPSPIASTEIAKLFCERKGGPPNRL